MSSDRTLLTLLETHVDERPNDSFLYHKYGSRYEAISFASLYNKVEQFSRGLAGLDVKESDKVGILASNCPEWVITDLAVLSLKAVVVPLYPTLSAKEIEQLINHAEIKVLILEDQQMMDKVLSVRKTCPSLKHLIYIQSKIAAIPELCIAYSKLLSPETDASIKMVSLKDRIRKIDSDQLATIIYTSGTTGEPKGVMLSHRNFISNVEGVLDAFSLSETDVLLSFLPLSHVFERTVGYYTFLAVGAKIYYARSIQTVLADLVDAKPTVFISVPRLYEKIQAGVVSKVSFFKKPLFYLALYVGRSVACGKPWKDNQEYPFVFRVFQKLIFNKVSQKLGGQIRFFVSGGAPLVPSVFDFFESMGFPMVEGYGLTETSPVIAGSRLDSVRKKGSVGQVLNPQEVQLTEEKELKVKGPNVMMGYYKNEKATKEVLKNQWFHTGDIARIDEDGYLFIEDRIKEIIVLSNGKKVAPQPIETLIKSHPYIEQFMLIGDCHSYITALIVPDMDAIAKDVAIFKTHADPKDWIDTPDAELFIRRQLAPFMKDLAPFEQVKKFTLIKREFSQESGELTPTLKLKRRVILKNYADDIEKMYLESL